MTITKKHTLYPLEDTSHCMDLAQANMYSIMDHMKSNMVIIT